MNIPSDHNLKLLDYTTLVRFIPGSEGSDAVQLIYEILSSYLLDPQKVPCGWLIDEETTHGHLLLECLRSLSFGDEPSALNNYGAMHWVDHLSKATSKQQ